MTFEYCTQRCLSCETDSIRACGEGVDGEIRTIRTDQHNVVSTLPSSSTHSQVGRMFSVTDNNTLDADVSAQSIVIINPPTSGRIMYLDSVIGGTLLQPVDQPLNYKSAIRIAIRGGYGGTPGRLLDIFNLNLGAPNTSLMSAIHVDASEGSIPLINMIQVVNSFFINFHGKIIVPPGHSITIQFRAPGVSNTDTVAYEATVTWYELDIPTP